MFSSNASQVSDSATYIEDIFSCFLYTGNGSTQTINNGIDLAGEGGLVWIKERSAVNDHALFDTNRGYGIYVSSNTTSANSSQSSSRLSSFDANGFSLGSSNLVNQSARTYTSWTFRKQPKFFDVVTYTGTGSARTVAHNLGSVPGCILIKCIDNGFSWFVYHRGLGATKRLLLNDTSAAATESDVWNDTEPTATNFTLGSRLQTNGSGYTYVAYLFAHNAGGFGLTGTDNVISCGSYTGNGSANGPEINLGYEPQYVLIKNASATGYWFTFDNMRGIATGGTDALLWPNVSDAEANSTDNIDLTATGFKIKNSAGSINGSGNTLIYIAIRRGPMKVPESGTSVLGLSARSGTGANATVTGGAGVTDLAIIKRRNGTQSWVWVPRLAGTGYLSSNATTGEVAAPTSTLQANPWDVMDGVKVGTTSTLTNASGSTFINYLLDRAPGFMDVVCYTGTGGAGRTVAHNLTVTPEMMIVRRRNGADSWVVYAASEGATKYFELNSTAAVATGSLTWNDTTPTSSVFSTGTYTNQNTDTYVAYLFATLAGVSKVGSYTGNGATQVINCGFTGGARFVIIKCTTAVGQWNVFDTARGMVAGSDWRFRVNTTDQDLNANWVYTATTGFELVTSNTDVNGTGQTYIFLAIA